MTQNIYDNPAFFAGYRQLGRSVHGLDGAAEWPALRAMLPALRGLNVADLGCGYGWFCRWAREHGAETVLGLDVSERMLDQARSMTRDDTITYAQADLDNIELPAAAFDLVYSSLTLHYIKDLARLFAGIHQALVPGGHLVVSMEHPIYMAPAVPGWTMDGAGRKSWLLNDYLVEGERRTDWLAKGVIKQHRTIGTTINLLIAAGFVISHLEEWRPTEAQLAATAALAEELLRPMFLLIGAHR